MLRCLRCGSETKFVGKKSFREGMNWGVLGEMGELFEGKQELDMYVCPDCGHVEFFVAGIGRDPKIQV